MTLRARPAVRSSLLGFAILLLATCGAEPLRPRVQVARPVSETHATPSPVAVVSGAVENADVLRLRLKTAVETFSFEATPGRHLAFAVTDGEESASREIAWPGESPASPTVEQTAAALKGLLARLDVEARVVEPSSPRAFVVELRDPTGEDAARIVKSLTATVADLRLLLEVRPTERYRTLPDGASRLRPWSDTTEAFDRYKEAEVAIYRRARSEGLPYVPSRSDLVLVPRQGSDAAEPTDFAVVEWPEDPLRRMDQRWVSEARLAAGPMGEPVVELELYAARADAFELLTRRIRHLPLAIVWRDRLWSAPVVQDAIRDRVQISLGSGRSRAEIHAEARRMAEILGGGVVATLPVRLVADVTWVRQPLLEALLPLEATPELEVELRAYDRSGRASDTVTRAFRFRPQAEVDLSEYAPSLVAALDLGLVSEEYLVSALRPFGSGARRALAGMLRGERGGESRVSSRRRRLAERLLVRLDATSSEALRAVAASSREDPDPTVRREAVTLLGRFRSRPMEALDALDQTLQDPDPDVRRAAARTIVAFGDQIIDRLPDLLVVGARDPEGVGIGLAGVPWELRDWALPAWLGGASSGDAAVRAFAVARLGHHADGRALDTLLGRLEDPEESVVRAAVLSLEIRKLHRGESDVPPAVARKALGHARPVVRAWAARELARGGAVDDETIERIRALLGDADAGARYAAAEALDRLGRADAASEVVHRAYREALEKAAAEAAADDEE